MIMPVIMIVCVIMTMVVAIMAVGPGHSRRARSHFTLQMGVLARLEIGNHRVRVIRTTTCSTH